MAVSTTRRATLLLVTESYPYAIGLEDTFLGPELSHLTAAFDRVVLVPETTAGRRAQVPPDVSVAEDLSRRLATSRHRGRLLAHGATSTALWRELFANPWLLSKPRGLARLTGAAARAKHVRSWVQDFLRSESIEPADCVAYTFWFDFSTIGLVQARRDLPGLHVVSRAHGADLYPERHDPPYLPLRHATIAGLDGVFPDSERGAGYLRTTFPAAAERCAVARMGVDDPGFVARASEPGHLSIVSCSRIVPVKRVDLILQAVTEVARRRPDLSVTWRHVGDGERRTDLEAAAIGLPANLAVHLDRYTTPDALFALYRSMPFDVFVNASSSEGTPVAVMEAISCGIPVVATAVGGNPEIVTPANGALVPPTATPDMIASAILGLVADPEAFRALRLGSRRVWSKRYDAATNHATFARRLRGLLDRPQDAAGDQRPAVS